MNALDSIAADLANLRHFGLYRSLKPASTACEPDMEIAGRRVVQFSSNNYLGLASHPAVKQAARQAIDLYGTGSGASRLLSGTTEVHEELEQALARFKQTESALVFATGSMANLGVLPCLTGSGGLVLLDELDHATLFDAARLSRARVQTFKHNDLADLESCLQQADPRRETVIAVDGVFSMDGDLAPLPGLSQLARRYGAALVVDEAHATGVLGASGRGTLEHYGLPASAVDVQTGTLSKALGSLGGFAACSAAMRELLINRSRSFLFATALPAACAAAALAALDLIGGEPARLEDLRKNTSFLSGRLKELGADLFGSVTPIVPVRIGEPGAALEAQKKLWEQGIYVPAIRPPTVARKASRLRISLMATHTQAQLETLLKALSPLLPK